LKYTDKKNHNINTNITKIIKKNFKERESTNELQMAEKGVGEIFKLRNC